jgi:hypothetical protein
MSVFSLEKGIKLKYSASYYPKGNGLAESTNKNLIKIIKRTVSKTTKTGTMHFLMQYGLIG